MKNNLITRNSTHDHTKALLCIVLALLIFALAIPAFAEPITKIELNTHDLTLEVGESYAFQVTYEPEQPDFYTLKWFVTDPSVIEVDAAASAVKALKNGSADIMAESFDGISYDICHVTVGGDWAKDVRDAKSGSSYISLSEADRAKIRSYSISHFIEFLEKVSLSPQAYSEVKNRVYTVIANVVPGTEQAESEIALSLGMEQAEPLGQMNVVILRGTFEQILSFVSDNNDLVDIIENERDFLDDPTVDGLYSDVTLGGHTEELTSISSAHKKGYTGLGSTIAVIDTGLNSSHPEFAGRVIAEACFSSGINHWNRYQTACRSPFSAAPDISGLEFQDIDRWTHGSHVAGIAAGTGGIAPNAAIIAVQAQSEIVYQCTGQDLKLYRCDASSDLCCAYTFGLEDQLRAFDYILCKANVEGINITAVNMSFSNGLENPNACDNDFRRPYFQKMVDSGIIPVAASGNEKYNNGIAAPACISEVFAVGALADFPDPLLANFSNHNKLVDITAPGSNICSASYPIGYELMDGTSMAAPMVTGGFALLHQAYPKMNAQDLRSMLVSMSTKTVSKRQNGIDIVTKPVLDFSRICATCRMFRLPGDMCELPRTGFSASADPVVREQPLSVKYSEPGLTLMIPSIGINTEILGVPLVENEFPVEWLGNSVGMLEGSAEPGKGVVVLTGHNHIDKDQTGPFLALGQLNEGDKIMLYTTDGKLLSYTVFSNEMISSTDIEGFETLVNSEPNSVTLLTCEIEQAEGGYAYRRVISASFDD